MHEILGLYNLHAYIKTTWSTNILQHAGTKYNNYNVNNIINIIFINYRSVVIDMEFSG